MWKESAIARWTDGSRVLLVAAVFGLLVSTARAQSVPGATQGGAAQEDAHTLDWPVGEERAYRVESGPLANPTADAAPVFSATVYVENAAWLRLFFSDVTLPAGSFVRMTALLDGEGQELDAHDMTMWTNSSAYFNGDTVLVELVAGPRTSDNQFTIDHVTTHLLAGERACGGDGCGICGADNRAPSIEQWACRLMPVGCTASVWSEESCMVSAGHCMQSGLVAQFNVPNSQSNCNTVNPPVADQFPISSYQYLNGGIGADWAVMSTGTNNQGQKAYQRYGVLRQISTTLASSGNPATIFGYGIDDDNPTRNQTQQTHTGTITNRYSTYYTYNVDMTYGNSGSALLVNNQIVGIVTHCTYGCLNYGTRVDIAAFANARNSVCPDTTPPHPDPMTFALAPTPVSEAAITMTATTAIDGHSPAVQYEFDFVAGGSGGTDSGWIVPTTYLDDGLEANTQYSYRVRARDGWSTPNVTGYSADATTTTFALVPGAPNLSAPTPNSMLLDVNAGGNPPYTTLAAQCTATSPLDPAWDGQYVDAAGLPSAAAVWQTDAAWGTLTLLSMQPSTTYTFSVKARNLDGIETALGSGASLATTSGTTVLPGDLNCDGQVDFGDINAFVQYVSSCASWQATYPDCPPENGDIDGDGQHACNGYVFDDVNAFVDLISGG